MKNHSQYKLLIPLFFFLVMLVSISCTSTKIDNKKFTSALVSSGSMIITNGNFTSMPGLGTQGDPYLFENHSIDGGGSGDGLQIISTTSYLFLSNCTIFNSGNGPLDAGIYLSNCKNVMITNCTIVSNHNVGIYLYSSQNIVIIGNNISKNVGTGLYFVGSSNNNVTRNLINNNHQGINLVTSSQRNIICANSFKDNSAGDKSGYAWDGSGLGNTWFVGIIGNYWGNYKSPTRYPTATTKDNVTWNTPYVLNYTQVDQYPLVSFAAHQPISIISNAQLAAFHGITGGGTKANPYLIQNMVIPAIDKNSPCILLQDINVPLKIFNITCSGGNYGLLLQNCTNLTVDKCKCSDNYQGCRVQTFSTNFTISNSNFSRNANLGIYIEHAANWSMVADYVGYNANDGVELNPYCHNITINRLTIESNGNNGLFIQAGSNGTLANNIIRHNGQAGISLDSCENDSLNNNTIEYNAEFGIQLTDTSNEEITDNQVGSSYYGITLATTSRQDKFHGNSLYSCSLLLENYSNPVDMTGHVIDASNTIDGKPLLYISNQTNVNVTSFSAAGEIILVNSSRCTVLNQFLSPATIGIQMYYSRNCTIGNCTFNNFLDTGISLYNSTFNVITNCFLVNCTQSLAFLHNSNYNTITGNKITNGHVGIFLQGTDGTISDFLSGNQMIRCGLFINSGVSSYRIDQTNKVNNKILYYYSNKTNLTPVNFTNAGQIYLMNCNNTAIKNCNLSRATFGFYSVSCNDVHLTNVTSSFNVQGGVEMDLSSGNSITNCTINNNGGSWAYGFGGTNDSVSNCTISFNQGTGIYSGSCTSCIFDNNVIQHNLNGIILAAGLFGGTTEQYVEFIKNDISFNLQYGIALLGTKDSFIIGNNVSKNQGIGLAIIGSSNTHPNNNTIYANIFNNNALGEVFTSETNIWNNATIGNCWGNYLIRYPSATTTSSKCNTPFGLGIVWNTPYQINGTPGIFDSHPFYQDPPLNLYATGINGQIMVSWQAPLFNGRSAITGYTIYRGTSPGNVTYLVTIGNLSSYTDSSETCGTVYYYATSAVNNAGAGTRSMVVRVGLATAPIKLQVSILGNQIVLTWQPPLNTCGSTIKGYNVYRGTSPGSESLIATLANVTTFTDNGTNLVPGQIYYYEVSAITGAGEGQLSSGMNGQLPAPYNPTLLIVIIIILIGIVTVVAVVIIKARNRKKVTTPPRYEAQPTVPETPPEISIKEALALDAGDMQRRIDEKQAILTRILEPQTQSEITAAAQQSALHETEALKVKKMKTGSSSEEVIEHKVDEQLEQEIKPQLQVERCIVCSTVLGGTSYVCPECKTKYCIRCAIELSKRNEVCWACKKPMKF